MLTRRAALTFLAGAVVAAAGTTAPAAADATASDVFAERAPFDRDAFNAALAEGGPVLIDVSASWCPTCKAQEAVLSKLMRFPPYDGFRTFIVDYDTEKPIMRTFGAQQRSTLIVFKDGAEVGRVVGDTRLAAIETLLAKAV